MASVKITFRYMGKMFSKIFTTYIRPIRDWFLHFRKQVERLEESSSREGIKV